MEILLFHQYPFKAQRFASSDTLFKFELDGQYLSRTVRGNSSHEEFRQKIVAASTHHRRKTNRSSICIHVKKNPANPEDTYQCLVRVHGFLWETENLDLWVEGLTIRVQVSCTTSVGKISYGYPVQFFAEIPMSKSMQNSKMDFGNEACIQNELFSEAKDIPIYNWTTLNNLFQSIRVSPEIYGTATISLVLKSNETLASENNQLALANAIQINKKILNSKNHSDIIIAAKDGTTFNCHKIFLEAHSTVFEKMLADTKESGKIQIEMTDMTPEGVKAFLDYLYTFDLAPIMERCDIALELLKAGHQFEIESLKNDIVSLMLKKEADWFTGNTAFYLLLFTRKVDSMKDLKTKAELLLISKHREFIECQALEIECEENSGD